MAKKLWGGRFSKSTDPLVEELTKSIGYDYKLAEYDALGSIAHVEILKKAGILTAGEAVRMTGALQAICNKIRQGNFKPDPKSEDIHTQIQNELEKMVGDLALKLHTARSRNDQVVFSTKLYCKKALLELQEGIVALEVALCVLAKKNRDIIIPGFTHMQHAQPVYLADYLGAYGEMLKRDYGRLSYIFHEIDMTMGAGALAGTPISSAKYSLRSSKYIKNSPCIDKAFNIRPTANSLDTVSDRDFVIDILSALSIIGMHLSRLAEDLVIWSTEEFDFVEIDESFCTGSSLMPQKKNPDALELMRGYTGRLYGNLVSVLTMMKGLPLAYNRDMQLDKEPLFSSLEIVSGELKILKGILETLKFNRMKIAAHLKDESLYATDLVYYLVDKGVAFKNAHNIVGELIRHSMAKGTGIKNMPEEELKKFSGKFVKKEVVKLFDAELSVRSKRSARRCD